MIHINELRIGNLFLDDDNDIAKIIGFTPHDRGIFKNNFRFLEVGCIILFETEKEIGVEYRLSTDLAKPISLTPEWLERMGFKRDKSEYSNIVRWVCANGFFIAEAGSRYEMECPSCSNWSPSKPFQYLHQLQNLYFALTGEEITIKENSLT